MFVRLKIIYVFINYGNTTGIPQLKITDLFNVKIQHWQEVQNFTNTHNFLAFSHTTLDSKLYVILKHSVTVQC
jgi:hypothetical protein